ncbi:MAG: radical SAM/SPASM domain-containing protein [Nitrospirota bacterium]
MFALDELCIEIAGKCLMQCRHCSSSCNSSNTSILTYDQILTIIEEAHLLGTKTLEISGGEPLLHPRILDIIAQAKRYFEVRLYTSGYLGNNKGIPPALASSLADLGLDRIIFNVQGSSAEIHELITMTPGSFESVLSSISQSKSLGLWTGVHFVPMLPNYKEIGALSRLCSNLKVNELAILRFVNQGRGRLNSNQVELSADDFHSLILDVVQTKNKHDYLQVRTGCPMNFCSLVDKNIKPVKCKAGITTLLIGFDGKVVPCPAFKQGIGYMLGNINDSTLTDIWNRSEKLNQLRSFDYRKIRGCSGCSNLDFCQGRCMAQRFYATGSIYEGPDPLCPHKSSKLAVKRDIFHLCAKA